MQSPQRRPCTRRLGPFGRIQFYAYDQADRMTGETWMGGSYTATFSYNKDSLLTEAKDPYSVYTYAYNADSQVTSVDNAGTTGVPTVTLSLAYDGYQNLTSVSDSLGGSVTYSYDSDNRLTSLALSLTSTLDAQVTFAYDGASRLTGITRTGASGSSTISSTLSYDNGDRLTNIVDGAKFTLANYTYAYNKGSQLTSYQDNSGNSLTYGYDPDGELTGATGTLASKSDSFNYDYDKNGNRTTTITDIGGSWMTSVYSTGKGNELTNDGTYTYTYDNDGNMLTQTNLTSGSVTYYSWDYENRLTEAKEETSSNGTVIYDEKYTYDVNGNRIGVSNNGTQELYTVYLGSNPYIDFNGSGTLTERYLFNPQALSVFYGQVSGGGTTEWFLTDNINSIREVVSTTDSVLDAITYDPYGNILNQTSTTYEPRFLYTGGAYDSNTDTYLDGAREYNPLDGRWLNQDPLGFAARDTNLYRYVGNVPTVYNDPSGLATSLMRTPSDDDIEWRDSGIGIGYAYQKGDWLFGWLPIHGFLVIDGKGYGFFEVTTSAVGEGQWRDSDLDVYPNKKTPAEGEFYSEVRPFLIDETRYDPRRFRDLVRKYLAEERSDPGPYIAGVRDCCSRRGAIIRRALENSRLNKKAPILDADLYGKPVPGQVPRPKRPVGPTGSSKYWL